MNQTSVKTNYPALYTLVVVYFFWGFFAAGNSIFIPFCKAFFHLDQFQSQLIDFSFYSAYYFGALILFIWSSVKGRDLITKWGFKNSIVYGLLFSTLGALAMILAVKVSVYTTLLIGLFIVALGFSLQQIAANPLAIALGNPKTGTSRVSLVGGINSLGATIGPLLMAFALFGTAQSLTDDQIEHLSLNKMIGLYAIIGGLFMIAASLFFFSKKIPSGKNTETIAPAKKAIRLLVSMTVLLIVIFIPVFGTYNSPENHKIEILNEQKQALLKEENPGLQFQIHKLENQIDELKAPLENKRILLLSGALTIIAGSIGYAYIRSRKNKAGWGAMQYPQLLLGMFAIFAYVGVEVGIGSNLGELLRLEEFGALHSAEIAPYISMYWGSLMIGRWAGAVSVFKITQKQRIAALIIVPFLAYVFVIGANILAGNDVKPLYYYSVCIVLQIILSFWSQNKSAKTMILFSFFGVLAMLVGLLSTGIIAVYAFLAGGLACSILWPAIFNIAIMGLGKYTAQGSSFLIMMILGGAIIPPIQGKLADILGIHQSYIIGLLCFAYLLFFGIIAKRVLKEQNIAVDQLS